MGWRDDRGEFIERNGNLELWHNYETGGSRHYLDGRPVHCGMGLELALADGTWMSVRYEVVHSRRGPEPVPQLHFRVRMKGLPKEPPRADGGEGLPWSDPETSIGVPSWAELRWPEVR